MPLPITGPSCKLRPSRGNPGLLGRASSCREGVLVVVRLTCRCRPSREDQGLLGRAYNAGFEISIYLIWVVLSHAQAIKDQSATCTQQRKHLQIKHILVLLPVDLCLELSESISVSIEAHG